MMPRHPQLICFCGGREVLRHQRCTCQGSCGCGASRCDRCAGRLEEGTVFRIMPDGGFVAGDRGSGVTSYAYPSSPHATQAKRNPARTAAIMVRRAKEAAHTIPEHIRKPYDARCWAMLDQGQKASAA